MKNQILSVFFGVLMLYGCGNNKQEDQQNATLPGEFKLDSNKSAAIQVGGVTFCIPSPFQTAMLIKQVEVNYNKELLNSPEKINNYSTDYAKALNLGIFGADLGYTTIYEQPQDGIVYLSTVRTLADELGVSSAFSAETIQRITKNIGNQDSLLGLVSICYRATDVYLKNNDASDAASLIITGGWVESMYFITELIKKKKIDKIVNRLGGQKQTLDNIIKLLQPFYNQPEFTELIDQLVDLYSAFEGVEITYTFSEPNINSDKKLTKVTSKTVVNITDAQLSTISEKIQSLRNLIAS